MSNNEVFTWKGENLISNFTTYQDKWGVSIFLNLENFIWTAQSYDEDFYFFHVSKERAMNLALLNLEKSIIAHASGSLVKEHERSLQEAIASKNKAIEQQKISISLQKMFNLKEV